MTDYKDAKADAKAQKARAKAMRPWFKKKRFVLPLAFVALFVIIGVAGSGSGDDTDGNDTVSANAPSDGDTQTPDAAEETTPAPPRASYPGREEKDHLAGPDGSVQFTGFTTTVKNIRKVSSDNQFLDDEICGDVTLVNRDTKAQDYAEFDWKLQTPSGDVKSYELTSSTLGSGQLVNGGTKSGTVCFSDPDESGQYVLIWKPDLFNADRGIWLINL